MAILSCTPLGAWDFFDLVPFHNFDNQSRATTLTFDNSRQSSDLVDVPVLVRLTPERFDYEASLPNGEDLRFFTPDLEAIPHEIETWNVGGESCVWILVPRLAGGSTTDFVWLVYGDPTAQDAQNPHEVWGHYELVYHLDEYPITDSGPGGNNGTPNAIVPLVEGRIGRAFPTSNAPKHYINTNYGTGPGENLIEGWTVEAWVFGAAAPVDTNNSAESTGPVMGDRNYNIGWDHDSDLFRGTVHLRDEFGYRATSLGTLRGERWYYLAAVYDGTVPVVKAFKDGALAGEDTGVGHPLSDKIWDTFIGTSQNTNRVMDGVVDEVRISAVPRSAEWVQAQYNSMTDNLITYGEIVRR
jgi:hypothetical protein